MGAQQREEAGCGAARDSRIGLAVSVDGHIVPEVARRFFEEVAAHAPGLVVVRRNLDRNPCGSSSGTGAAVSANLCVAGVGTETDGSVVCPSSANGLAGLKPTVGLVSRAGIITISQDRKST